MTFHGLQEGLSTALKPLEEVRAAESHQALACTGEVVYLTLLFLACVSATAGLSRM